MHNTDRFSRIVEFTRKLFLRTLAGLIMISSLFAFGSFAMLIYHKIVQAPILVIDSEELFEIFSFALIIVIAFELIDALMLVISTDKIPTLQILQIGIVAVSTKIITLDMKHTDFNVLIGFALLLGSFGLSYYLVRSVENKSKGSTND